MSPVDPGLMLALTLAILVCYYVLVVVVGRRLRSLALSVTLYLLPVHTLFGAVALLRAKSQATTGYQSTYLESLVVFVRPDSTYLTCLVIYGCFLFLAIAFIFLANTPRLRDTAIRNRSAQLTAWAAFSHITALAILVVLLLLQTRVVESLSLSGSAYGRIDTETSDGRFYSYLTSGATYLTAIAVVALAAGWSRMATPKRWFWLIAYGCFFAAQIRLSLQSGQRRYMLIALVAVLVGLADVRPRRSKPSAMRLLAGSVMVAVGAIALAAVGSLRGQGIGASTWDKFVFFSTNPSAVLDEFFSSAEFYASHMSLYGVLVSEDHRWVVPMVEGAYPAYTEALGISSHQGFTMHPVAAWWFSVGVFAPVAAALMVGVVAFAFRWVSVRSPGRWNMGFIAAAATLPAAGIPLILMRGDSTTWRGLLMECLVVPGLLAALPFALGGSPKRGIASEPSTALSLSREDRMAVFQENSS